MLKWIKFLKNYTVQAENGESYQVGDVVQVSPGTANHFITRKAAVEVDAPVEPKVEPKVEKIEEPAVILDLYGPETVEEMLDEPVDEPEPETVKPPKKKYVRKRKHS